MVGLSRWLGFVVLSISAGASSAIAGETENIIGCIDASENYAGIDLSYSDAKYQGKIFSQSKVFWSGVTCEVKSGAVSNLVIDGVAVVSDGWPVAAQRSDFEEIAALIDSARDDLASRSAKLGELREGVERQFRSGAIDVEAARSWVSDEVAKIVNQEHAL